MSELPLLASSFVAGFVAPSIVAWYALSSQRRDERRLRRDELRVVLDEAAQALGRSRRAVDEVARLWSAGTVLTSGEVVAARETHESAAEAAQDARDRLAIRLGEREDAMTAFLLAADALHAYAQTVNPYLRGERASPTPADKSAISAAYGTFASALDKYFAAARTEAALGDRSQANAAAAVAIVTLLAGAALLGWAAGDQRSGGKLRVNGSELQALLPAAGWQAGREATCRPSDPDGIGRWMCALEQGSPAPREREVRVFSDGRVAIAGTGTAGITCCVDVR